MCKFNAIKQNAFTAHINHKSHRMLLTITHKHEVK